MRGSAPPATSGARPSRAPAPLESEEATIVMKGASPHPSAAPTVRQQAPSLDRTPTPTPGAPPPFPGPPLTAPAPAPVMAASRRSMLTLALAGIGVLLLLVVLAAAGIILLKRPAPVTPSPSPVVTTASPARRAPPPTTLPPVTSGTVHVESTPAGATVAVDGEKIGKTPLDTPALALGAHQVTLELDGYTSTSDSVTLTAESPATQVKQTLSRTAPATGVADVTSTPAGATVKIDGTSVGTTPLRGRKLNVGRHRVEVSADGYDPFAGSLTVREGQTARLDAALHPVPAPSPIHTPPARAALPDDHVYDENDAQIQPKPIKVSGKSAEYPKDAPALKRGQRSSVTVSFVVLDSGEVSDVQVVESAGSNVDEAVISAYKTWKFTPGMRQGSKVRVRVTRRQTFLGG
jgi:TonB family protein